MLMKSHYPKPLKDAVNSVDSVDAAQIRIDDESYFEEASLEASFLF